MKARWKLILLPILGGIIVSVDSAFQYGRVALGFLLFHSGVGPAFTFVVARIGQRISVPSGENLDVFMVSLLKSVSMRKESPAATTFGI